MEQLSKNVYSRYGKKDLEDILRDSSKKQIVLTDLDETIHKGRLPGKFRGISEVDLSMLVCFQLIKKPLKIPGFIKENVELLLFEKKRSKEIEDYHRSMVEDELIPFFCNRVLYGVPISYLENAAEHLPRYSYPFAKESIIAMAKKSEKLVIVSKGIEPVLKGYKFDFFKKGIDIEYECNKLLIENGRVAGLDESNTILTKEDKKSRAEKILKGYEKAIIIGNSGDDIGLFEAGDVVDFSLKIAVYPHSEEVEKNADVVLHSWKEFYRMFNSPLEYKQ